MTSNDLRAILANAGDPIYAANWNRIVYSLRRQFNVMDYGAKGDGTTDDTAAIQAAINACHAGGGGQVFFPFPPVRYLLAGDIHPTWRCQLFIPLSDNAPGMPAVELVGEGRPNMNVSEGFTATADPTTGCLLYSTATAAQAGDAVLGVAWQNYPIFDHFNFTNLSVTNLHIVVRSKDGSGNHVPATMSGINGQNIASLWVEWTRVRTESDNYNSVAPATGTTGIWYPHFNNKFTQLANQVIVSGFETGVVITEHFTAPRLAIMSGVNALRTVGPVQHPASIGHLNVEICANTILQEGLVPIHINTYQVERLNNQALGGPARWNDFQRDLKTTVSSAPKVLIQAATATRSGIGIQTSYTATDPSRLIIKDVLNSDAAPTVTAG